MSLEPGQIFAGKYRIERLLGAGGMGEVFAATHLELGELVALKVMLDEDVNSTDALARFQREARAAARLKSEFIARVLDVGRQEGGLPFIVLEHIVGQDLHEVCGARGPLPIAEAAGFVAQTCEGVAEAHALGMVHRDLKLKNLFLTKRPDGRPLVKILDFGVVKLSNERRDEERDQPSLTLTQAETLIGSLPYMAPEQIQMSSKVDARADVWSLGVCLYELLAGTRPFHGQTVAEIITAITRRPPPPVRSIRSEIPQDLADTVERALEKSLHRRFQSVAELARALAPHVGDPTLGDRVQAVLLGGVAAKVALVTSDPALDATRNWAVKPPAPKAEAAPASDPAGGDTTTRALPLRPSADVAPAPAQPAPAPAPAFAPVVATQGRRGPVPLLGAVALGIAFAVVALLGWINVRGKAHPPASSTASATTTSVDPPRASAGATDVPAVASSDALPASSPIASTSAHTRTTPVPTKPHSRAVPSGTPQTAPSGLYDKF